MEKEKEEGEKGEPEQLSISLPLNVDMRNTATSRQELKPEIGMPCVAAAQATQTTNTDINSGLAERRNALYHLFRHLNDRKVCSILMH
mmetsp:Transcript_44383/g.65068  ORF Transcript_44383/g.65068 Transcript_44383/m.65068 type:complete len:88 (+) Transcript_44383:132-395(+)